MKKRITIYISIIVLLFIGYIYLFSEIEDKYIDKTDGINYQIDVVEDENHVEVQSNLEISQEKGYYYKSIVAEEKEFGFMKTLENNDLNYNQSDEIGYNYLRGERPICPGMPNKESCIKESYGPIYKKYSIGKDVYELVFDEKNKRLQNSNKYFIFKNNTLIFEDTIEMVGARSPYKTYEYNGKLLFIYTKNKGDNEVLYNVFYNGEYINKKYDFENVDGYFSYNDKEGFIIDKTKLYFNGKILPYRFDYIQNTACCTAPSLFKVYNNGKLLFANKRGNTIDDVEFELIELDLNNYLKQKTLHL